MNMIKLMFIFSIFVKENYDIYYVFHDRVTLFFADNFSTECRITMEFIHNFF